MQRKMYFELPVVLSAIIVAMLLVWNINFSWPFGSSKPEKSSAEIKEQNSSFITAHPDWMEGKALFKVNCASCHNPKSDGAGPALMGVTTRWDAAGSFKGKTGRQWLRIWIHNWNDVVEAGYKYGVNMANSRPAQMNVFPYLSDAEIDKILLYVNSPDLNLAPLPGSANKAPLNAPHQ